MHYKIIPFVGSIDVKKDNVNQVAKQLEIIVNNERKSGWKYVRLESVSSYVNPDNGCFGIGARKGYSTTRQMIVFEKNI